jgi:hypothetical protein
VERPNELFLVVITGPARSAVARDPVLTDNELASVIMAASTMGRETPPRNRQLPLQHRYRAGGLSAVEDTAANGSLFFGAANHVFGAVKHVREALHQIDERTPTQKHVLIACSGTTFVDIAGAEMIVRMQTPKAHRTLERRAGSRTIQRVTTIF